jgi:NADH-ubiquinone oxidoreductase chain 5
MNHAYFKALLFLSAGSVIHALADEQDMRKMGGLVQILPMSYIMILIGSLALMGTPFLTGFYSKDVILEVAYVNYNFSGIVSYWLGLLSAGFTSFYSFRLIYLTFLSNPNGFKQTVQNAHDAPFALGLPLFILGICSLFIGFTTKDLFVGLGSPFWNNAIYILPEHVVIIDAEFLPPFIKWLPFLISLFASFFAFFIYSFSLVTLTKLYKTTLGHDLYLFINRKWLFDKLQNELIIATFLRFGYHTTYKVVDKGIIELFGPVGLTNLVKKTSKALSNIQSGLLNHYAYIMFMGLFSFLSFIALFTLFQIFVEIHLLVLLCLALFLFTLIKLK